MGLTAVAVLALAACGSGSPTASSSTTTSGRLSTTTTAVRPTTTTATAPSTTTTTLVAMQTANGGEFLSPSGNISCEVNYQRSGLTSVYCQTNTPPRSATLSADGSFTMCTGMQCLGNPGLTTPTLAYGATTGVGPYRCTSATSGVTCTADGKGFRIATSGITPVTS